MINEIDVKNIKKELAARKAMEYKFEKGGTIEQGLLKNLNEEILKDSLNGYENAVKIKAFNELKQLVQDTFDKYGKEGDNMIALDLGNYDDSHFADVNPAYEEWCWQIRWDRQSEYLRGEGEVHYKPIGWDECDSEHWPDDEADALEKKYQDLFEITNQIMKLLSKLVKTTDLEDVGNMDATNECWYAVTTITRDLKFVSFVIRDDGLPLNNDGSFYHEEDLNKIVL